MREFPVCRDEHVAICSDLFSPQRCRSKAAIHPRDLSLRLKMIQITQLVLSQNTSGLDGIERRLWGRYCVELARACTCMCWFSLGTVLPQSKETCMLG